MGNRAKNALAAPLTLGIAGAAIGGIGAALSFAFGAVQELFPFEMALLFSGGLVGLTCGFLVRGRPFDWLKDIRPWFSFLIIPGCIIAGMRTGAEVERARLPEAIYLTLYNFLFGVWFVGAMLADETTAVLDFLSRTRIIWDFVFWSLMALIAAAAFVTLRETSWLFAAIFWGLGVASVGVIYRRKYAASA